MARKTKTKSELAAADTAFAAFISRVESLLLEKDCAEQFQDHDNFNLYGYRLRDAKAEGKVKPDPHLYVKWSTGGVSGGSCYGGDNYAYTNSDPVPDLTSLDLILEAIKPDLTFLQYKRLVAAVQQHDSWKEDEYYGNSTNYTCKKVRLRDLFDFLSSEGWLS